MKKIISSILFALLICSVNAQSVAIQCNTPNCFFTDPNPFQTVYSAISFACGECQQQYDSAELHWGFTVLYVFSYFFNIL